MKELIDNYEKNKDSWEKLRNEERNKILGIDERKSKKRDDKKNLKGNL